MRLLLFLFIAMGCLTEVHRQIRISDVGWTFNLPIGISLKDSAFDKDGNIKKEAWRTTNYVRSEESALLLSIEAKPNNYFNSMVYIDSSSQENWEQYVANESRFYISQIDSIPHYEILDSIITKESIGGVDFQKEYFKVYNSEKKNITQSYQYSRRYKNYSIYYNIRFTDTAIGKQYLQILKTSIFDR